jgi:hypothetical protein
MKSNREMMPTTMFSIERSLHFLAESGVKNADREENHHNNDENQVIHSASRTTASASLRLFILGKMTGPWNGS